MQFRTEIITELKSKSTITYESEVFLLGSCFAENIGDKLEYFQFKNMVNPFGILYHPLATELFLTRVMNADRYSENEIFERDGVWRCLDAHSRLASMEKTELLNNLNSALDDARKSLLMASHLIVTFGTAWVYRKIDEDRVVANCHKIPRKYFLKELLSVDEISESLQATIALLKEFNPRLNLIFTVSPVRHLRDGLIDNSVSKAHLRAGIQQIVDNRKNIHYFPAFEIMLDDLRDYRFYKPDMIHPNETAVGYIWERFKNCWISEDCFPVMDEVHDIRKALSHRPFQPESGSHKAFLKNLDEQTTGLLQRYPHMRFG